MKCGFFDCNNPVGKGQNSCRNCGSGKREEWKICSACRQPEPEKEGRLSFHNTLILNKLNYHISAKMRDKAPSQFQAEFDQILPDLKLSEAEKKLIYQAEKVTLDFLAKKGGKQDNSNWFKICSVCDPELEERQKEFLKQHPEFKSLMERIEKAQEKTRAISKKIEQAIGKEKWEETSEKEIEELNEEIGDNWRDENYNGPTSPGNQDPNNNNNDRPNTPKNNNSAKITQLQQEINSLKQEVRELKKSRNPSSPSDPVITEKEQKIKDKEKELENLKKDNNSPSTNQPSKNDNPNLLLYLGLGAMGVVIFVLAVLLILTKKKKNINSRWKYLIIVPYNKTK